MWKSDIMTALVKIAHVVLLRCRSMFARRSSFTPPGSYTWLSAGCSSAGTAVFLSLPASSARAAVKPARRSEQQRWTRILPGPAGSRRRRMFGVRPGFSADSQTRLTELQTRCLVPLESGSSCSLSWAAGRFGEILAQPDVSPHSESQNVLADFIIRPWQRSRSCEDPVWM